MRPAYDIYDKAGNHTACPVVTRNVYFDKKVPTCPNSQNSTWTNKAVTITWGCADGTGQSGCNPSYSGGSKTFSSTQKTYNVSAYTIKDNAGNSTACPAYTSNVYVDTDKPSCSTSKSNTYTVSGVTVSVSCSDTGGSGVKTCPSGGSGHKSTQTYTVVDNAGNTKDCQAVVSSQRQKRTKSCDDGNRCDSAACQTYNSCRAAVCGTETYTYTGTCTVTYYCYYPSPGSGEACGVRSVPAGKTASGSYTKDESCDKTGTRNKSCRNSSCSCQTHVKDIATCGCASWGSYGSWSNVSSCSSGESSNHSTTTDCRTLYY